MMKHSVLLLNLVRLILSIAAHFIWSLWFHWLTKRGCLHATTPKFHWLLQFDTNVSMVWKRPLVLGLKDSQATYWSLAFKLQWKIPPCSFTGLIPLFFSPCLCEWHNQRRKLIWILKPLISSRIFSLDFELKDLAPFTSFQIKYTPSFFIHRTKCSS